MRRKRFVPEKIISMLREAEVGLSQGLTVPKKQPKRSRLWLNDGSCVRLKGLLIATMSGPMIL